MFGGPLQNYSQYLAYLNSLNGAAMNNGMQTAAIGSDLAFQNLNMTNEGMLALQQMDLQNTNANIQFDLSSLGQRNALGLMSKQVDQFVYSEMVREKISNLFIDLEKTKMENAFNRAKQAAQAARY
jgi:hypothetical protein